MMAGIVSTLIFAMVPSISGLWLSMVPTAALGHTFLVLKAVLSDHFRSTKVALTCAKRAMLLGRAPLFASSSTTDAHEH